MKICTYSVGGLELDKRVGLIKGDNIYDVQSLWDEYFKAQGFYNHAQRATHHSPKALHEILQTKENPLEFFQASEKLIGQYTGSIFPLKITKLHSPIEKIPTYRDFYTHEKHVKKGFEKRNEPMPDAWYDMPVYYKGSTAGFIGTNQTIPWPSFTDKLDYELEIAAVMASDGKNIKAKNAYKHILGFCILNDVSARDIQKKEMSVRLGPSKGKDFCSVLGPYIVTMDEFDFKEPELLMQAFINGDKWSEGKSNDAHFTFAQMIEFASKDEWLLAGDVLGSGTVGTGCGLELDKWIRPGDVVELKIENLGSLINEVGSKG